MNKLLRRWSSRWSWELWHWSRWGHSSILRFRVEIRDDGDKCNGHVSCATFSNSSPLETIFLNNGQEYCASLSSPTIQSISAKLRPMSQSPTNRHHYELSGVFLVFWTQNECFENLISILCSIMMVEKKTNILFLDWFLKFLL